MKPIEESIAREFLSRLSSQGTGSVNGHGDVAIPTSFSFAGGTGNGNDKGDKGRSYELMKLHDRSYLCSIPVHNDTAPEPQQAKSAEETALSLATAKKRGWELLKPMRGTCLYYSEAWWTYKLCHDSQMVQFHALPYTRGTRRWPPREDPKNTYIMGQVPALSDGKDEAVKGTDNAESTDENAPAAEVAILGTTRYLVHYLAHGTVCDLTLRERKSEIQYHCDPTTGQDYIERVQEVATCSYIVTVRTPRLCGDEQFLPAASGEREDVGRIECAPIGDPKQKSLSLSGMHSTETEKGVRDDSKASRQLGGIIPGEGALLRNPDTDEKVDISHIMDSQKITILASSPGMEALNSGRDRPYAMSQEKLNELGIDPNFIAQLRNEVSSVAGGRKWRMEMVEYGTVGEDGTFEVTPPNGKKGKDGKMVKPRRKFQGIVEKFDMENGGPASDPDQIGSGGSDSGKSQPRPAGFGQGRGQQREGQAEQQGNTNNNARTGQGEGQKEEEIEGLRTEAEWDEIVEQFADVLRQAGVEARQRVDGDGQGNGHVNGNGNGQGHRQGQRGNQGGRDGFEGGFALDFEVDVDDEGVLHEDL